MNAVAPRLRVQLMAATFARVVINTGHRMVYPFLPVISRGLGVPVETLAVVLSARSAVGMSSPLFGSLPDRLGRRRAMFVGLGAFCLGLSVLGRFPSLFTFFLAVVLIVAAKFIFDPALQAHLGDRIPYRRRGLVIAITELGWSGAALVGIPAAGFLIARGDWRSPLLPLAGMGLVAGLALWLGMPRDPPAHHTPGAAPRAHWTAVWRNPIALSGMALGALISAANENVFVVYGLWLESAFGLTPAALGLSTTIIGVAEMAGEGLVMFLADRVGIRRAVAGGLAASAAAYLGLPLVTASLGLTLGMLFVVFVTFEFAIVASIPLMTELVPEARARVMSANVAAHAAGRMLGVLLGSWVYRYGFVWNGVAATVLTVAALVVVIWFVRERTD